jgi:ATP-dependent helicase/nuclease subunit A
LLSASHAETASEFGICVTDARGEMRELRLDRTFVDDDGYRWVVDFKISAPAGDQPESVFIEEAGRRHAAQLAAYRDAIRQLDRVARPVRAALYFPLLPRLVEVTLEPGGASE